MNIDDVCKMAKEEGLSYGNYVYKHAEELAGKKPTKKAKDNEQQCKYCGNFFVPINSRNIFCRNGCRVAFHQKNQRKIKKK